uniref:Lectin n=1 Tax=Medicago truncatula TaxID=3880 RepID=Q43563_MEDTR|nr:lectin [Medicago truncatula]
MASSNIFQISFSLIFLTFFFILLLNKVNSIEFTSFAIIEFSQDQNNLIFQGDAYISSSNKLQLNKAKSSSVGRALYSEPIHIWDSKTGLVAHFDTSFNFIITAPDSGNVADGFTFFLAPVDTQPQDGGGFLGLFNDKYYNRSLQTVAVEFDTYYNSDWDPRDRHIGIDVNCVRSTKTKPWVFRDGGEGIVLIKFDASTNVLSVTLFTEDGIYTLSDVVNVKVLPEWVRVGFSAATGRDFSVHDILSWRFSSILNHQPSSMQAAAA